MLMAVSHIALGQSYTQIQLIKGYKRRYSCFAAQSCIDWPERFYLRNNKATEFIIHKNDRGKGLRRGKSSQGWLWAKNNVTLIFTLLFYNRYLHYFTLRHWLNTEANMGRQLCPHISYCIIKNIVNSSTHINSRHKLRLFFKC